MIKYLKSVNNRIILYLDIQGNLEQLEVLDLTNWAVFVIGDNADDPIFPALAGVCIEKDVAYMSATGKACSIVDDIFDETIVGLKISGGRLPRWMKTGEDVLMTTWHNDFSEGFWFITSVACNDDLPIDKVVVVNLTPVDHSQQIEELIININKGWLPKS